MQRNECHFCVCPEGRIPVLPFGLLMFAGVIITMIRYGHWNVMLVPFLAICALAIWPLRIYVRHNVIHRHLHWFQDPDDPRVVHHHQGLPLYQDGLYRDRTDRGHRVILGPILVQSVAGWGNEPRVLQRVGILIEPESTRSEYPSFQRARILLSMGDDTEVWCSPRLAFLLLSQNIRLHDYLDRSRILEETRDSFLKLLKAYNSATSGAQMLVAIRDYLASFPTNSKAAKGGRERIDAYLASMEATVDNEVSLWRGGSTAMMIHAEEILQQNKALAKEVATA